MSSERVMYAFAAMVEQEDADQTWVPRIIDQGGAVAWDQADGRPTRVQASGLTVYLDQVAPKARLLSVRDVDISLYVSRARLVSVCRRFDKGGGWVGTSPLVLVFNAASIARARVRSHGKFLVGQLWWPWLSAVGYMQKTSWLEDNTLRLVAVDGFSARRLFIDFILPKREDGRRAAELVLSAATASRATHAHLNDDERAAVSRVQLPRYVARSRRFAIATIPGAHHALASTTNPGR